MILIIGGASQGKRKYARNHFPNGKIIDGFHHIIEQCVNEGVDPIEHIKEKLPFNKDTVIILNEMGSGVVPIELHERRLRDEVGRVGCYLAEQATEVHRVIAGIGMYMKRNATEYFPVFMNFSNKKILVVGAGRVALRRIQSLRSFGAEILVIAKEISEDFKVETVQQYEALGVLRFQQKSFTESDLTNEPDIVIAATNDSELNEWIHQLCRERGILVNVASNHELCDFYFPAVAKGKDIVVGITGNGNNHKQVAKVAADIRAYLKKRDEDILDG